MKINEILELMEEAKSLSEEKFEDLDAGRKKISEEDLKSLSHKNLCAIVASNRYLKIDPQMELSCMLELARRRNEGDPFDFEAEINEYYKTFTPIETNLGDLFSVFSKAGKII